MIDETGALADPLQGARVTVYGRAEPAREEGGEAEISRPPPGGRRLCRFPGFRLLALKVEGAHYIGGFGRIFDLAPDDLLVPLDGAEGLVAAEPGIVEHMNEDHADAVELYATALADACPGRLAHGGHRPRGLRHRA